MINIDLERLHKVHFAKTLEKQTGKTTYCIEEIIGNLYLLRDCVLVVVGGETQAQNLYLRELLIERIINSDLRRDDDFIYTRNYTDNLHFIKKNIIVKFETFNNLIDNYPRYEKSMLKAYSVIDQSIIKLEF